MKRFFISKREKERLILDLIKTRGPSTTLEIRDALGYRDSLWFGYWIYNTARRLSAEGQLVAHMETGVPDRQGHYQYRYSLPLLR